VKPVDFSNVRIACSDAVPPNTILVSRDVYERLKAQNDQKRTIEGEVVREAKKQLDEGNDDLQVCRETRLGGGD
jgi:hypothetical protein